MDTQILPDRQRWLTRWLPAAVLAGVGVGLYAPSFSVPFLFDDIERIVENPAIRRPWPPWGWLTYSRRPVAYFTLAVNYSLHGRDVWGYHAVNLAIHVAAGWTLFGIVARTLTSGELAARYDRAAPLLAAGVALVWLAHPLQIQAVTYIVQRMESLMALLVLMTLYAFICAQEAARPRRWYAFSAGCCVLAALTKEVAVAAPLLVLWYDRTFVADSWAEMRKRLPYYAALFSTWAILALVTYVQRSTYVGSVMVVPGLNPWRYALTQAGVIVHYLRLCFWPVGQCFDYAWPIASEAQGIVPPLVVILALLGTTVWCAFRSSPWGFLGAWFFLFLAPTSSVLPIVDIAVEHRMYLPSAAVATAAVLAFYSFCRALGRLPPNLRNAIWLAGVLVSVALLGRLTLIRNGLYQSTEALWADVLERAPHNPRAHSWYAVALSESDRFDEALTHFHRSLDLDSSNAQVHLNLGWTLFRQGRLEEALERYNHVLAMPDNSAKILGRAHSNIGVALKELGQIDAAIEHLQTAVVLQPQSYLVHSNLGAAYALRGELHRAIVHYEESLRLEPFDGKSHSNLGNARLRQGRFDQAERHFREALRLDAADAKAHLNLADTLDELGRYDEALEHYREAIRLAPGWAQAYHNLGVFYFLRRRNCELAAESFRQALRHDPSYARAKRNLQRAVECEIE